MAEKPSSAMNLIWSIGSLPACSWNWPRLGAYLSLNFFGDSAALLMDDTVETATVAAAALAMKLPAMLTYEMLLSVHADAPPIYGGLDPLRDTLRHAMCAAATCAGDRYFFIGSTSGRSWNWPRPSR